jgi:hypothetical protein
VELRNKLDEVKKWMEKCNMDVKGIEEAHETQKKCLVWRNLQLEASMQALKVSAAYMHLCAMLIVCCYFGLSQNHPIENSQPAQYFLYVDVRLLRSKNWSYRCSEVNAI